MQNILALFVNNTAWAVLSECHSIIFVMTIVNRSNCYTPYMQIKKKDLEIKSNSFSFSVSINFYVFVLYAGIVIVFYNPV